MSASTEHARVPVRICAAQELIDGGKGIRFEVVLPYGKTTGFVIRFGNRVYGYLNQCAHVPTELDWNPGEFFDQSGLYLICATHGAVYEPESGRCVLGPCRGKRLRRIEIVESQDSVYWLPDDYVRVPEE